MSIPFAATLPDLPPGLSLRFCHLDDDRDIALHHAASSLAPTEANRASAFRFDRDRARFVRARGFLRRELAVVLGGSPDRLELGAGPNGKPCVIDQPLGFNLSHSAGLAVLALNAAGPVGIDLEALALARNAATLSDTCLTPVEGRALENLSTEELETRFLAFWTAKEAAVKLTGTGWSVDPKSVRLRLAGGLPDGVLNPMAKLIPIPVPGHLCHVALQFSAQDLSKGPNKDDAVCRDSVGACPAKANQMHRPDTGGVTVCRAFPVLRLGAVLPLLLPRPARRVA